MANLKNITELPVTNFTESLKLIVNDNGSAKQIAASAVGAQADWNQNDETAPDYVKNRPFYEGKTEIPILENAELTLQLEEMADVIYSYGDPITFSVDHEYRVVVHSQSEDLELFAWPESETVCDFRKDYPNGRVVKIEFYSNQVNTHGHFDTLSLYKIVEGVHKLDPKYLPDAIQSDWNQSDETALEYVKNRPFYERAVPNILVEAERSNGSTLPSANFIIGEEYVIEYDSERYSLVLTQQYDYYDSGYYTGFNLSNEDSYKHRPTKADSSIPFLLSYRVLRSKLNIGEEITLPLEVYADDSALHTIKIIKENVEIKTLDPKYLPDSIVNQKSLILDANLSDYYGGHPEAGDEALEAIKAGRQILVRVPNASGHNYVATYSPIYMYQVPLDGMYLYLFYLKDEKQDLSALLGQPAGTVVMPTYGEFMMLLSKNYDSNPIE